MFLPEEQYVNAFNSTIEMNLECEQKRCVYTFAADIFNCLWMVTEVIAITSAVRCSVDYEERLSRSIRA